MKKPTLIVLIGPTGVGKTELSLSIAEYYHTSIIPPIPGNYIKT